MIRNISIGIDIGTATTKVVVGEFFKGEKNPKIIGMGESKTEGLRHGYVAKSEDAIKSLKTAIQLAEKTSGINIKRAFVSIGGATLRGDIGSGSAIVSKADSEVTNLDIQKALEEAEENLGLGHNKKIIQVFPIAFKLDGKEVLGRPEGSYGNKLEVKALFVTVSNQHFEDLMEVITEAGITPIDIVASPVAGSVLALSKKQKIVGGAVLDLGAETVSISIFENEVPVYLYTFPIGGEDITNDIALGLRVTLEEAENVKLGNGNEKFSKKKIDEIIDARVSDILEAFENHLKKIKRSGLLPAGVVWIGGGSNIANINELSKSFLKLPSQVGSTEIFGNIKTKLRDPAWFVALGLVIYGQGHSAYSNDSVEGVFKDLKSGVKNLLKQLMP